MGSVQTIIVFAAIAAFLLVLWPNSESNEASLEENLNSISTNLNPDTWQLNGVAIGLAAAIAATVLFPNPYTLFAAAFLAIYAVINAAVSIITGGAVTGFDLSTNESALITVLNFIITTVFTLSLVSWFKGGSNL